MLVAFRLGCVAVLASTIGVAAQDVPNESKAANKSWFSVNVVGGEPIGFGWRQVESLPTGRKITETYETRIRERGNLVKRFVDLNERIEDEAGRTVSIFQQSESGGTTSSTRAQIYLDHVMVMRKGGKDVRSERINLPANVRFDNGAGLLKSWDFSAIPKLTFDNFNLGARAVEQVVIVPHADMDSPEGGMTLLRSSYGKDGLVSVSKLVLNKDRAVIKTSRIQFGVVTETRPLSEPIADIKKTEPFSVLQNSMMKAPYRILDPALQAKIRYVFRFREGIIFTPPTTVNQRVTIRDDSVTLDICSDCGPSLPISPEVRADALRATAWMQSDHFRLKGMAAPVKRLKISDAQKMERLAIVARTALFRQDFSGHYSALEAVKRGAGDCTEDAVVLATLARAAGIPAKVASGLAYSRPKYHGVSNVFMPHNWVLAYADGRWQSFDMSLGAFDSTHIALTIGDGDPRSIGAASQLAGLLIWEKMTEVRKRPELK